jgi:hypothetical protein
VIYRNAKLDGLKNKGRSAKTIVGPIIAAHFSANLRMQMVNASNLSKAVNCARAKERPVNPTNLDFSFVDEGIPDGLNVNDIIIGKG